MASAELLPLPAVPLGAGDRLLLLPSALRLLFLEGDFAIDLPSLSSECSLPSVAGGAGLVGIPATTAAYGALAWAS